MVKNLRIKILDLKFRNEFHLTIFTNFQFLLFKDNFAALKDHDLKFSLFLNLRFLFLKHCFPALKAHDLPFYFIILNLFRSYLNNSLK